MTAHDRPTDDSAAASPDALDRRPLRSRDSKLVQRVARTLAAAGVRANAISACSMVAAALAAAAMVATRSTDNAWTDRLLWLAAAAGIQLRLLANLLDGLVAVEGNQRTPTGELWNEVPDRVSDTLILVAAGVTCTVDVAAGAALGLAAALVAMFVSYVRAVGKSLTGASDYSGPMAKPQRMATLTVAAVATAILPASLETQLAIGQAWLARPIIALALLVITLGGVWTGVRRLRRLARSLTNA